MKKIIKKIVCLSACMVGFSSRVNAATLSIGGDAVAAGSSRSVTVELVDDANNLGEFKRVEFQVGVSGTAYASIDSFSIKATTMSFKTEGTDVKTYIFSSDTGLNAGTIGTINYKTTEELVSDFKITPNAVKFCRDVDGTDCLSPGDAGVKISEGTVKFQKPKSNEAILTSLQSNYGEMTPEFSSDVTEYTIVVKDTINMVKLTATSSPGSTRTGTGNISLEMGANEKVITVTAEDGVTTKDYKITVIRGSVAEPSAFLKSLDVNNIGATMSPDFDKDNNKYTIKITKDINELDFIYEREDPLAEVTIEGNENFQEGENLVTITVQSSDGEKEQVYEITVIMEEEEEKKEPVVSKDDDKKKKKPNIWLIVGIVIFIVLIVVGVSIVLFKKKKKTKKKDDSDLPLKHREGDEPTYEIDKMRNPSKKLDEPREPHYESLENDETDEEETESVTAILKGELFDEEKTQRFDSKTFKEVTSSSDDDDNDDETKEFNF